MGSYRVVISPICLRPFWINSGSYCVVISPTCLRPFRSNSGSYRVVSSPTCLRPFRSNSDCVVISLWVILFVFFGIFICFFTHD